MAVRPLEDDLPVQIGETVADKYRIERLIGSGGMGVVVEATHLQLLQRVAIKFVRADTLDESSAVRLLREARAAVALESEHVVRVLDVGTLPSGVAFLVMEYFDGETLAARLGRTKNMAIDEVVWVASQACKGLAEAHRRGIVHRDVKPANLFLARRADGVIVTKLLDFGIAKVSDPGMAVEAGLTSSDHALGTPRYMSPEQLTASARVDARTDVWSLGVVFFECLVGEPPFARGTSYEVGAHILASVAPRVSDKRPEVPPALVALVARCLERDASARYADASEVLSALEGSGIATRAIAQGPADARAIAGKDASATAVGLGVPAASLPATRVAPVVPAASVAPGRTAAMGVLPARVPAASDPSANRAPKPKRFELLLVAAVAILVVVVGAAMFFTRSRRPVEPSGPSALTAGVMTPDGTAEAPVAVVPSAGEPLSPGPSVGAPSPQRPPAHPSSAPRRVAPRPVITRPPNER